MKKLIFSLLSAFILVTSCESDKYSYIYDTYTGIYPALEIQTSSGNTIQEPAFELVVKIEASQISLNNSSSAYSIVDDNEDFVLLTSENEFSGKIQAMKIKYMKKSQELIFLQDNLSQGISLMTKEKILEKKLNSFATVQLVSDISHLSDNQKKMLGILFQVADLMEEIYWEEAYGDKSKLMLTTESDVLKKLYSINYGPWERLNNNKAFLPQFGEKYAGANFYPRDMTAEEFDSFDDADKKSLYTIIRRNSEGELQKFWYHEYFKSQVEKASRLLLEASLLSEDEGFKIYLEKRAEALLTDNYYESDVAWMEMKNNKIDFVVGPIENYEDNLYSYKAAHESFILIKDMDWSETLLKLVFLLTMLQKVLPVSPKFKAETPGTGSDMNVYDAVYYAGDCNAGSKTIAINLPNDPKVRANYGSRKLQLKNSIRYKFEKILIPIANVLITEEQRQYIDFNAFFENTMFHEVAHGLGLDYTINGKGSVRQALKENYTAIEEGKADILGLYIVTKLAEMGELGEKDLRTNYVTFMASTFRSVRFGVASAHGKANMIRFYYFQEMGAFSRDEVTGTYSVDFDKMKEAMKNLTIDIITMQGLGDYEKAKNVVEEKGYIRTQLQNDLSRLNELSIPVDLVFEQGSKVLEL